MCEYGEQVLVKIPDYIEISYNAPGQERRTDVMIDECLVDEIKYLWAKGVHTQGCCCGHGKNKGDIGVIPQDAKKMRQLGYITLINSNYPEADFYFMPKSGKVTIHEHPDLIRKD